MKMGFMLFFCLHFLPTARNWVSCCFIPCTSIAIIVCNVCVLPKFQHVLFYQWMPILYSKVNGKIKDCDGVNK